MTKVFPIIAIVARIEYAVRVKVVIPGGGWFGTAVDELEMFISAVYRMNLSSTALFSWLHTVLLILPRFTLFRNVIHILRFPFSKVIYERSNNKIPVTCVHVFLYHRIYTILSKKAESLNYLEIHKTCQFCLYFKTTKSLGFFLFSFEKFRFEMD